MHLCPFFVIELAVWVFNYTPLCKFTGIGIVSYTDINKNESCTIPSFTVHVTLALVGPTSSNPPIFQVKYILLILFRAPYFCLDNGSCKSVWPVLKMWYSYFLWSCICVSNVWCLVIISSLQLVRLQFFFWLLSSFSRHSTCNFVVSESCNINTMYRAAFGYPETFNHNAVF